MKNWKTTLCGVLTAVGVVSMNLVAGLDDDPTTVIDIPKLIESLALIAVATGLIAAKDSVKEAPKP